MMTKARRRMLSFFNLRVGETKMGRKALTLNNYKGYIYRTFLCKFQCLATAKKIPFVALHPSAFVPLGKGGATVTFDEHYPSG